ncbi:MAG: XdhC family protein [Pseudomonadales bacterium]
MQAVDAEVLNQVHDWLRDGHRCWLATVIETWGSSPRPVGSLFACDARGHVVGSLSGGCVEDDLLDKLTRGELAATRPQYFQYGITTEETEKFGLPCGGSLHIVIEPLQATSEHGAHFAFLRETLAERGWAQREVNLQTGASTVRRVDAFAPLEWCADTQVLRHVYGPRTQLFIIGAGMVSKYLAEMARTLDVQVTVCDPREHLLQDFGVAGVTLVNDMPDDAVRRLASDPASAVVALTHDPRIDDMGLMEALTTDAFYVGAMGSTRTSASRRERLRALDLTEAQIARLHAPIGLPIGSKTPPEIAIAILAELIQVRHQAEIRVAPQSADAAAAGAAGAAAGGSA